MLLVQYVKFDPDLGHPGDLRQDWGKGSWCILPAITPQKMENFSMKTMKILPLRKAFTLTELLIVLAVFAVLLSLLSPALRTSLEISRGIVCGNKISAYAKLNLMYTEENNGYLIPQYTGGTFINNKLVLNAGYWPKILLRPETSDVAFGLDMGRFISCPSRGRVEYPSICEEYPSWGYNTGIAPDKSIALNLSKINSPSETFMFVENIVNSTANRFSNQDGHYLISNTTNQYPNYITYSPHVRFGVQAYVDGHVSKHHESIMNYYWNTRTLNKPPFTP